MAPPYRDPGDTIFFTGCVIFCGIFSALALVAAARFCWRDIPQRVAVIRVVDKLPVKAISVKILCEQQRTASDAKPVAALVRAGAWVLVVAVRTVQELSVDALILQTKVPGTGVFIQAVLLGLTAHTALVDADFGGAIAALDAGGAELAALTDRSAAVSIRFSKAQAAVAASFALEGLPRGGAAR